MANFVRIIDRFPEIMAAANAKTQRALDHAADDIETGAKSRSRVDTGTMRNGWTTEKVNESSRLVYNPVAHTIYNEYGTMYMAAQPMLKPAVEEVTPKFIREIRVAWAGGL